MANSIKPYVAVDDSGGSLRDISDHVTRVRWGRTADMLESHGVADSSKEFTAGLKDGDQIQIEGIWDNASTTGFVAVFSDSIGATRSIELDPNSNTSGQERIKAETVVQELERSHGRGELVAYSVTLQVTGTVTEDTFA